MVLRVDRSQRGGPDPTLHTRIVFFALGAGCAFAGIYYGVNWLITLGIVILAVGVLIRLINDRRRRDAQEAAWREQAEFEDDTDAAEEYEPEDDVDTAGEDEPDGFGEGR